MKTDGGRSYIGIDLGGTNIKMGLLDRTGQVMAFEVFPTRVERGHGPIIDEMAERAMNLCRKQKIPLDRLTAVGVGSPGPLDPRTGVIFRTPNLRWENVHLRDLLLERLEKPVFVDNDAVSATFGEWWTGAGRDYGDVVGLTLGTGLGGGIVLNGKVHHGFLGTGGHIGHMVVHSRGRRCPCGNDGCLEAYASATAMIKRAEELLAENQDSMLQKLKPLTGELIYEAARKGDQTACQIFNETAFYLAVGINNVMNILNPEAVIVMGAVANAGELLFRPIQMHLEKMALFRQVYEETKVVRGTLGDMAGVVGAAGLAKARAAQEAA